MMYSTNVQLVKWTFPAVALIIGLFWYKRRRIHRADPGGDVESNSQDKMKPSFVKEINSNFYDDTTSEETDKSFSISSCTQQEAPARVPRKASESIDIPIRKSVPQSCDSSQICAEDEPTDIQLGSNPTTSYLETFAKKQDTPSFEVQPADNITKVSEDVTEEESCSVQNETEPPLERTDTVTEFSDETNKELTEEHPKDAIATAGQAVYERDSANHSPMSGVLEGSIIDEVRSEEGSTDSGKGECSCELSVNVVR